jgi:CheY-like chemotaxis protein
MTTGRNHRHDCESTVLVVDDQDDVRETLQELLEEEGYRVATAPNGRAALEVLHRQDGCCLILLDLMMPVMDGWQMLAALQQEPRLARIPVVVLSSVVSFTDASAPAVQEFLQKPADVRRLLAVLREHCCGGPSEG